MLEVINLSKKYGKTLAVDGVSFAVPNGKIGILLGPNGAGKSTVIKSIAGLLRYKGEVRIQGYDSRSIEAKKCFAYVPELPYMYEALTVREHIEFITRAYGVEIREEERNALFEKFELTDKQQKLGNELSKGMMQKVSICCALAIKPRVILLDEPMVGLDPAAIKELKNTILERKEDGCTVLISTHMLEMVKELWDVTFVMDKGHILGTYMKEALANEDLEELYFSVTGQTAQSTQTEVSGTERQESPDMAGCGPKKQEASNSGLTGSEEREPSGGGRTSREGQGISNSGLTGSEERESSGGGRTSREGQGISDTDCTGSEERESSDTGRTGSEGR